MRGCAAARRYWDSYGASGFTFTCTGCDSCRPQGETYVSAPDRGWVKINEACPVAYRNETSNAHTWRGWLPYAVAGASWSVQHVHGLDPYGFSC